MLSCWYGSWLGIVPLFCCHLSLKAVWSRKQSALSLQCFCTCVSKLHENHHSEKRVVPFPVQQQLLVDTAMEQGAFFELSYFRVVRLLVSGRRVSEARFADVVFYPRALGFRGLGVYRLGV